MSSPCVYLIWFNLYFCITSKTDVRFINAYLLFVLYVRYHLFTTFFRSLSVRLHVFILCLLHLLILYFCTTIETDVRFANAYLLLVLSVRYHLFTTFFRSLSVCLHVFPLCLLNLVILYFWTTSKTDVRFANSYLLLVFSFRYHLFTTFVRSLSVCLHFFPMCLLNLVISFFFVPLAKRMSVSLTLIYSLFCMFAITCLLLFSVRYRFVYMSSSCVCFICLFCIFVPLSKRMSVSLTLIYS